MKELRFVNQANSGSDEFEMQADIVVDRNAEVETPNETSMNSRQGKRRRERGKKQQNKKLFRARAPPRGSAWSCASSVTRFEEEARQFGQWNGRVSCSSPVV